MFNLFKISRLRNIDQSHEITYVHSLLSVSRDEPPVVEPAGAPVVVSGCVVALVLLSML